MPTVTLQPASATDDGSLTSTFTSPYTSVAFSSYNSASNPMLVDRTKSGASFENNLALIRFDPTSSIPAGAVITAAIFRFYIVGTISNTDSRSLVADYLNWSGVSADWTLTAPASPILTIALSSLTANAQNDATVTDLSGITPTASIGIRLHVSGGAPTGSNTLNVDAFGGSHPAPQLIVTYTVAAGDLLGMVAV